MKAKKRYDCFLERDTHNGCVAALRPVARVVRLREEKVARMLSFHDTPCGLLAVRSDTGKEVLVNPVMSHDSRNGMRVLWESDNFLYYPSMGFTDVLHDPRLLEYEASPLMRYCKGYRFSDMSACLEEIGKQARHDLGSEISRDSAGVEVGGRITFDMTYDKLEKPNGSAAGGRSFKRESDGVRGLVTRVYTAPSKHTRVVFEIPPCGLWMAPMWIVFDLTQLLEDMMGSYGNIIRLRSGGRFGFQRFTARISNYQEFAESLCNFIFPGGWVCSARPGQTSYFGVYGFDRSGAMGHLGEQWDKSYPGAWNARIEAFQKYGIASSGDVRDHFIRLCRGQALSNALAPGG